MFLNMNVTEWESNIGGIDMPDFYITFAAIVSSTLTLSYPDFVVEMIAAPLFDGFNVDQEVRNFILNEYLPEVKDLVLCHASCIITFPYIYKTSLGGSRIGLATPCDDCPHAKSNANTFVRARAYRVFLTSCVGIG